MRSRAWASVQTLMRSKQRLYCNNRIYQNRKWVLVRFTRIHHRSRTIRDMIKFKLIMLTQLKLRFPASQTLRSNRWTNKFKLWICSSRTSTILLQSKMMRINTPMDNWTTRRPTLMSICWTKMTGRTKFPSRRRRSTILPTSWSSAKYSIKRRETNPKRASRRRGLVLILHLQLLASNHQIASESATKTKSSQHPKKRKSHLVSPMLHLSRSQTSSPISTLKYKT